MLFHCWSGKISRDFLGLYEIAYQSWMLHLYSSNCEWFALNRWKIYSWREQKTNKKTFCLSSQERLPDMCLVTLHSKSETCYLTSAISLKFNFCFNSVRVFIGINPFSVLLRMYLRCCSYLLFALVRWVSTLSHPSLLLPHFWKSWAKFKLMGHSRWDCDIVKFIVHGAHERVLCGWRGPEGAQLN